MTSPADYQQQIARTADAAIEQIRKIQEACSASRMGEISETVCDALVEADHLHGEMAQYLRHGMAKEVLNFRQTHPREKINGDHPRILGKNPLQEMYMKVAARMADTFLRMYDISNIDGPDEERHEITKAAFVAYAAAHQEIPERIARMSKPRLAFEIASTGVYVLNDHIGRDYPEKEIRMGIRRGVKQLLNAIAAGTPVNTLPEWRMNKFYDPGLRVF